MFGVEPTELMVLGVVAILVIPPKDLPRAMRTAGHWVGKARGVARQFRSGFDELIRESELAEMEKRWAAENERILREHPATVLAEHDATMQPVTVEKPVVEPAPEHPPGPAPDKVNS